MRSDDEPYRIIEEEMTDAGKATPSTGRVTDTHPEIYARIDQVLTTFAMVHGLPFGCWMEIDWIETPSYQNPGPVIVNAFLAVIYGYEEEDMDQAEEHEWFLAFAAARQYVFDRS